jgi:hypothetical protein
MSRTRLTVTMALVALPLTLMASERGSSNFIRLSDNDIHGMIMKMSDYKVGATLTSKQSMLGGNCKVVESSNGLALYTLSMPGKEALRFGIKQPSGHIIAFSPENVSNLPSFLGGLSLPLFIPTYTNRTEDEKALALKELGAAFKSEIADRSWPCGSVEMESRWLSLSDLRKEVKFYKDEDTGRVVCIDPNGKAFSIRKPDSCEYEPLLAELPAKLCRYLVHLTRREAEDALFVASRASVANSKQPIKASPPSFLPWDEGFNRKLELSRLINSNPNLVTTVEQAHVPAADDFLSAETLALLDQREGSIADFNSLPQNTKLEFTKLAFSIESIRSKSNVVQPSPELLRVVDAVKPHVTNWVRGQQNLRLELYTFPLKAAVEQNFQNRIGVLSSIWGKPYNLNLNCSKRPKISLNPTWITSMLGQPVITLPPDFHERTLPVLPPRPLDDTTTRTPGSLTHDGNTQNMGF